MVRWLLPVVVLLAAIPLLRLPARGPLILDYAVSLAEVDRGQLTIVLTLQGELPDPARLVLPYCGALPADNGVSLGVPSLLVREATGLRTDGGPGRTLSLTRDTEGWLLHPRGDERTRLVYLVDLNRTSRLEEDIRLHLTVPSPDGFRAAGYHIFLVPDWVDSCRVSVRFGGTTAGTLAVPWPGEESIPGRLPADSGTDIGEQSLGRIIYRPSDLRDLYNSLLAWGDLRVLVQEVAGCTLRLGIRETWLFEDADLAELLRRITAAEIAFFGSAPQATILCLVGPNPIQARESFDYYGVHVGHSLQLFLDPLMTYADLTERAANVAAHEMFHGWLGEAIQAEDPQMAWFVEGVTTWYAPRVLKESGIWAPCRAENVVGERIAQHYYGSPLLGRMTIAEAAADIMRDGETTRFAYAGGALAAANLDRWLASISGTVRPLDEVLRYLYAHRGQAPLSRHDLSAAIRGVTGVECAAWLDHYVYGKETLPHLETLF